MNTTMEFVPYIVCDLIVCKIDYGILLVDTAFESQHICIEEIIGTRHAGFGIIGRKRITTEVYYENWRIT